MKRIRPLPESPSGLHEYLASVDKANWEEFRSHNDGAALSELRDALAQGQHELCAYCEIEIKKGRRQIEHVIPRSDSVAGGQRTLDFANMVACCMGTGSSVGLADYDDDHTSCGQAKGNENDSAFIDPRTLPEFPSVMSVGSEGVIEADEDACQAARVASEHVARTIRILNLNTKRLCLAREKWVNDLVEKSQHVDGEDGMLAWIREVLTPDGDGRLAPFFTTARWYFGAAAERVLHEEPRAWI